MELLDCILQRHLPTHELACIQKEHDKVSRLGTEARAKFAQTNKEIVERELATAN